MVDGRFWGGDQAVVEESPGEGAPGAVAVASVSWMQVPYGPNRRSLAWRIGIVVLPEHRNRGIGAAAQRLLAEDLFASSPANRIEAPHRRRKRRRAARPGQGRVRPGGRAAGGAVAPGGLARRLALQPLPDRHLNST